MIVFLVGYMGSGKSTIGKKIAKLLQYEFIDLDDYIQEKEQQSVASIFKTKGEIYFRKQETHYLKQLLQSTKTVISLGGGTPCYGTNMQLIANANNAVSIYLKASISTLVNRLNKEKAHRPLINHLNNKEDLQEFVGKHLFERAPYYNKSKVTITTDDKLVEEIVKQIVVELI